MADGTGLELTLCGYLFTGETLAHRHYLEIARDFKQALKTHEVEPLAVPQIGQERIAYNLPPGNVRYAALFRSHNLVYALRPGSRSATLETLGAQ